MKKHLISTLAIAATLVLCMCCFAFTVSAEGAADGYPAPGGTVTNGEELITALGGADNAELNRDGVTVYLKRDILLESSIYIDSGNYRIIGRGCSIYRGFVSGAMFQLTASKLTDSDGNPIQTPSLTLGAPQAIENQNPDNPDLVLDGNKGGLAKAANGPIVALLGKATVTINPSTKLINNHSTAAGGAIYMESFELGDEYTPLDPTLTVIGGEISGNTSDVDGGAIAALGNINGNISGSISINSCLISGNTVTNPEHAGRGGAIYVEASNFVSVSTEFKSNSADMGGALYVAGEAILTDCTLTLNRAEKSGGAIYGAHFYDSYTGDLCFSSVIILNHAFITENSSGGEGGAITNQGKLTLPESSPSYISNNTSIGNGAVIHNSGELVLDGSEIFSNVSTSGIGAIYNSGTLTFNGADLRVNTAVVGGAIYNTGTLYFYKGCSSGNKCTAQNAPQIANLGKFVMKGSFVIERDIVGLFPAAESSKDGEYTYIDMPDKITTNAKINIAFYKALPSEGAITSCKTSNSNGRMVFYGLNMHTETAVGRVNIYNKGSGSFTLQKDGSIKKDFPTATVFIVGGIILAVATGTAVTVVILKKKKKSISISDESSNTNETKEK